MKSANALREAQEFFQRRIPLTRAMELRVLSNDEMGFVVEAPVAPNHNHLDTAFGGSINAVATLAGYGLLWLELRDEAADVVIRDSSIRFFHPIRETIRAVCERPTPEEWRLFQEILRAKGKARIALQVQVIEHGRIAADFQGTFVALRRSGL
jgi:thioesterase domain-containing protein